MEIFNLGGRTAPLSLYCKPGPNEEIKYYDVRSLYPYINATARYPVGIPTVHIFNKDVSWTKPEDNPYPLSILKVLVQPPRHIDIPILPVKVGNRLLFPTCYACCKQFPEGGYDPDYSCQHSDEERQWVSSSS
jgi:hypothetical protein